MDLCLRTGEGPGHQKIVPKTPKLSTIRLRPHGIRSRRISECAASPDPPRRIGTTCAFFTGCEKCRLVQLLYLQEDFSPSQQMGDRLADPGERVDGGHRHV
jgi:hypothetical protein